MKLSVSLPIVHDVVHVFLRQAAVEHDYENAMGQAHFEMDRRYRRSR